MLRKEDISLSWVDNLLCALLEGILELRQVRMGVESFSYRTDNRYNLGWFSIQPAGKLFIVGDEVCDIDITRVPLD